MRIFCLGYVVLRNTWSLLAGLSRCVSLYYQILRDSALKPLSSNTVYNPISVRLTQGLSLSGLAYPHVRIDIATWRRTVLIQGGPRFSVTMATADRCKMALLIDQSGAVISVVTGVGFPLHTGTNTSLV